MTEFQEFEKVDGPVGDLYKFLWGASRANIFTSIPVAFVDYDNEFRMDSSGDQHQAGETTESQKTFEIMEIKKALELFGMQKGTISLKLLVRDEYKVAEKAIESNQGHGKGGMMITGQSGIGKTSCLIYLLVVRLLKKELTFYQRTATLVYMFCEQGVFTFSPDIPIANFLHASQTWFGSDREPILLFHSNTNISTLPELFCGRSLGVFVIQAAPPTVSRSASAWMRGSAAVKHVMNPWTWSEMVTGNPLQPSPVQDIYFLRETFEALGPSARECYETLNGANLARKVEDIKTAAFDHPLQIITELASRGMITHASDKIILVRAMSEARRHFVYEFGSVVIARICFAALKDTLNDETREKFALCTKVTQRLLVGVILEDLVHNAFTRSEVRHALPETLHCLEYVGGNSGRYNFKMSMAVSESLIPSTTLKPRQFSLGSDHIVVERGSYYQPDSPNHPTADAFFIDNSGHFTLIQIPFAQEHSIKHKRLEALQERLLGIAPATDENPWRILLVIPKGQDGNFGAWVDQEGWAKKLEMFVLPFVYEQKESEIREYLGDLRLTDWPL